jgi:hypothetical protein
MKLLLTVKLNDNPPLFFVALPQTMLTPDMDKELSF